VKRKGRQRRGRERIIIERKRERRENGSVGNRGGREGIIGVRVGVVGVSRRSMYVCM
jgi:hypothetical protein